MTTMDFIRPILPYLIAVTAVIVLVILILATKGFRRKGGRGAELSMLTVDAMKKKGLLTKEEYEQVRKKTAERELERMRGTGAAGTKDLNVMQELVTDPDAVRKLLTPEELAVFEARQRLNKAEAARQGPKASEILMGTPIQPSPVQPTPAQPAPAARREPEFITDPLEQRPPQPAMNMTPVVRANQEAAAAEAVGEPKLGELELLLAKGAISQEEYARLKQFFK